jgi:hypothetical protein
MVASQECLVSVLNLLQVAVWRIGWLKSIMDELIKQHMARAVAI